MTIAVAYAIRKDADSTGFWLVADSRLTLDGGSWMETFVKTLDLTEGVAVAIAGSTLATTAAAEIIRPLVTRHNLAMPMRRSMTLVVCTRILRGGFISSLLLVRSLTLSCVDFIGMALQDLLTCGLERESPTSTGLAPEADAGL
jgi:hypothetical protein